MIFMGMEILLSTILAIIFLAAAIPKLRHPMGFILAVLEYRVLPTRLGWFYGWVVPPLEFLLALLLLSGTALRSVAVVVALLLLSFIVAVGINLSRDRDLDCHCFGKTARRPIGWKLLFQDGFLFCASIVLAVLAREWATPEPWSVFRLFSVVQAGSLAPLLICAAVTACTVATLGRSIYGRRLFPSSPQKLENPLKGGSK